MGELVNTNNVPTIIQLSDQMLEEARNMTHYRSTITLPIGKLGALGAGVAELVPSLHTITQIMTFNTEGLYRLTNQSVGDVLKATKSGDEFWGALKTSEGKSKMLKLAEANPLTTSSSTIMPPNPATIMMAATLYSIERELDEIKEMQRQILNFLEREKQAEIEADLETLINIISNYKLNWDNENYIKNNHKMVLDIQRTARKNMNAYQKEIAELLNAKKIVNMHNQVKAKLNTLENKFNYYRLSLYIYSLAALLEILLSGNFKDEYIIKVRDELLTLSTTYRKVFRDSSLYIEKMSKISIDTKLLKGVGNVTKGAGDLIGKIQFVKEGAVDEFLQDHGQAIKGNAKKIEKEYVGKFASLGNPQTAGITNQMDQVIKVYNHTKGIYFDQDQIYLVTE